MAILHSLLEFFLNLRPLFSISFPKDSKSQNFWTSDFGKWGQKEVQTVPQKCTDTQTHQQTHAHMNTSTYRKHRPEGLMLCKHPYIFVLFLDTVKQIALKRGNSVQRPKESNEADKELKALL